MDQVTDTTDSVSEALWTDLDADTELSADLYSHVGEEEIEETEKIDELYFEIGNEGVWTVSTVKPGNGVDKLRDESAMTFWQTNGLMPHHVQIQFYRRTAISHIRLFCDYRLDESYTPSDVAVFIGNDVQDLFEVARVQLNEPDGWVKIPLTSVISGRGTDDSDCIYTSIVRLMIFANHLNGRDSHIRQIKLYSRARYVLGGPIVHRNLNLTNYFISINLRGHMEKQQNKWFQRYTILR